MDIEDALDSIPKRLRNVKKPKEKLIALLEILCSVTDEEHGLTVPQLVEIFNHLEREESCTGNQKNNAVNKNTVTSDIRLLKKLKPFGVEIKTGRRGTSEGVRCTKGILKKEHVRALINMTRACKFITAEQKRELSEKLYGMVSGYEQDDIASYIYVDRRDLSDSANVFAAVDASIEAMKRKRLLQFQYVTKNLSGKECPLPSASGSDCHVEIPLNLVFSFGNYYLETLAKDASPADSPNIRRLDRMRNVRVLDEAYTKSIDLSDLQIETPNRIAQLIDMWGDGTSRTLFLRVQERAARYVYDRFGVDTQFHYIDNEERVGYVCVNVQLGPTFYRWLFGMSGQIDLVKPVDDLWAEEFWKSNPGYKKTYGDLINDFDSAQNGYAYMLSNAASSICVDRDGRSCHRV